MNIVLTLQNTTYQSLMKCSVHQAAYKMYKNTLQQAVQEAATI